MKKMALFVEGQTEQEFVRRLLIEIAGQNNVHIDTVHGHGGGGSGLPRQFLEVQASRPGLDKKYYVLIYDSSGDSSVLSDIRDQYESLTRQGYSEILGMRDVHPLDSTLIPQLRANFSRLVHKVPFEPTLILAIREIESWFIAEHTHFARRNAALTLAAISAALG